MSKVTLYNISTGLASQHHAIDARTMLQCGGWSEKPGPFELVAPVFTPPTAAEAETEPVPLEEPVLRKPDKPVVKERKKPGRKPRSA